MQNEEKKEEQVEAEEEAKTEEVKAEAQKEEKAQTEEAKPETNEEKPAAKADNWERANVVSLNLKGLWCSKYTNVFLFHFVLKEDSLNQFIVEIRYFF